METSINVLINRLAHNIVREQWNQAIDPIDENDIALSLIDSAHSILLHLNPDIDIPYVEETDRLTLIHQGIQSAKTDLSQSGFSELSTRLDSLLTHLTSCHQTVVLLSRHTNYYTDILKRHQQTIPLTEHQNILSFLLALKGTRPSIRRRQISFQTAAATALASSSPPDNNNNNQQHQHQQQQQQQYSSPSVYTRTLDPLSPLAANIFSEVPDPHALTDISATTVLLPEEIGSISNGNNNNNSSSKAAGSPLLFHYNRNKNNNQDFMLGGMPPSSSSSSWLPIPEALLRATAIDQHMPTGSGDEEEGEQRRRLLPLPRGLPLGALALDGEVGSMTMLYGQEKGINIGIGGSTAVAGVGGSETKEWMAAHCSSSSDVKGGGTGVVEAGEEETSSVFPRLPKTLKPNVVPGIGGRGEEQKRNQQQRNEEQRTLQGSHMWTIEEAELGRDALLALQGIKASLDRLQAAVQSPWTLPQPSLYSLLREIVHAADYHQRLQKFVHTLGSNNSNSNISSSVLTAFAGGGGKILRQQSAALQSLEATLANTWMSEVSLPGEGTTTDGDTSKRRKNNGTITSTITSGGISGRQYIGEGLSPLQVALHTKGVQRQLALLADLCGCHYIKRERGGLENGEEDVCVWEQRPPPTGAQILSMLYTKLTSAASSSSDDDGDVQVLRYLFAEAMQPYLRHINNWAFSVEQPMNEFSSPRDRQSPGLTFYHNNQTTSSSSSSTTTMMTAAEREEAMVKQATPANPVTFLIPIHEAFIRTGVQLRLLDSIVEAKGLVEELLCIAEREMQRTKRAAGVFTGGPVLSPQKKPALDVVDGFSNTATTTSDVYSSSFNVDNAEMMGPREGGKASSSSKFLSPLKLFKNKVGSKKHQPSTNHTNNDHHDNTAAAAAAAAAIASLGGDGNASDLNGTTSTTMDPMFSVTAGRLKQAMMISRDADGERSHVVTAWLEGLERFRDPKRLLPTVGGQDDDGVDLDTNTNAMMHMMPGGVLPPIQGDSGTDDDDDVDSIGLLTPESSDLNKEKKTVGGVSKGLPRFDVQPLGVLTTSAEDEEGSRKNNNKITKSKQPSSSALFIPPLPLGKADQSHIHISNLPAPIHGILEACVIERIMSQYRCVSKAAVSYFLDHLKLLDHLNIMRQVFFMESGDFADNFTSAVVGHADTALLTFTSEIGGNMLMDALDDSCLKEHPLVVKKNVCFRVHLLPGLPPIHAQTQALLAYSLHKKQQNLNYINEEEEWKVPLTARQRPVAACVDKPFTAAPGRVDALDPISIDYDAGWPLSTILTPDTLQGYTAVFSSLLRLRRVQLKYKYLQAALLTQTSSTHALEQAAMLGGGGREEVEMICTRLRALGAFMHSCLAFIAIVQDLHHSFVSSSDAWLNLVAKLMVSSTETALQVVAGSSTAGGATSNHGDGLLLGSARGVVGGVSLSKMKSLGPTGKAAQQLALAITKELANMSSSSARHHHRDQSSDTNSKTTKKRLPQAAALFPLTARGLGLLPHTARNADGSSVEPPIDAAAWVKAVEASQYGIADVQELLDLHRHYITEVSMNCLTMGGHPEISQAVDGALQSLLEFSIVLKGTIDSGSGGLVVEDRSDHLQGGGGGVMRRTRAWETDLINDNVWSDIKQRMEGCREAIQKVAGLAGRDAYRHHSVSMLATSL